MFNSVIGWRRLMTLFLIAFACRCAVGSIAFLVASTSGKSGQVPLLNAKGDGYERIAMNLVNGHGFRFKPGYAQTTLRMPLYPAFLAAIFAVVGENVWVVRTVQSMLGAVTCVLIAVLGSRVGGARAGWWSGLAWAVYPGDWIACARYGAEPLAVLFTVLSALLLLWLIRRPSLAAAVVVGVGLALATQSKSSNCMLPTVFLVGLLMARSWRGQLRRLMAYSAAIVAVVALASLPWMWRGYRVSGHWFYPSTLGGCSLMDGYYVTSNLWTGRPVGRLLYEARALQGELARVHGIGIDPKDNYFWTYETAEGEFQMDRLQREQFKAAVRADPWGFAKRSLLGLARYWYLGRSHQASLIAAMVHLPFLFLGLLGAVRVARLRIREVWPWVLILAHYNVMNAVIDPLMRYAVYAMPFVCLLGGCWFALGRGECGADRRLAGVVGPETVGSVA